MATRDALPLEPVPAELDALWNEALADAGFTRGEVEFLLFDGHPTAPALQWGLHLGPGDTTHDLEHCFTEKQRDAVDKLNLYKHRVVIWVGDPRLPPKLIQALMRHEMRHAEQFAADETVYRIGIMTLVSLARVYAGTGAGATSIHRFAPQETDANAAATQLVAPAGDAGEARDGEHRSLVTATDPVRPLGELGLRTLAFAALHPEAFVAEAQYRRIAVQWALGQLDPDGPALFQLLRDDAELTGLRAAIVAAIPTAAAIAAAGDQPARAWTALHEQLAAGLRRAEELLGVSRTSAGA
jgi:hypothetical protein